MRTILLIEQDPGLTEKYISLLKDMDLETEFCNRVGKAVERLRCFDYDAMVVDFGVKGMNPAEVIPVLKKISPQIPIIALTDKSGGSIEQEIEKAGVFSCLKKPVKDKDFLDIIGQAVGKNMTVH
jgi:DNA-binding NtrC family response regulator